MTPKEIMDMRGDNEERLNALFAAYRDACGSPEPDVNFMPNLWRKIEARQRGVQVFARWARALATAGVALSMVFAVLVTLPGSSANPFYQESYMEALVNGHSAEVGDLVEPVQLDLSNDSPMSVDEL